MLEELRSFSNLGTPNYFFELLNSLNLNRGVKYKISDINNLFYNRIIDGSSIFDGCVELALKLELILKSSNSVILNEDIIISLKEFEEFKDKFVEFLFKQLKDDDEFYKIFSSENLSYDVIYKSLQIDNNAFGLKYSNFKNLLLDFSVILNHPLPEFNSYIINIRYKKFFDTTVLTEVKKRKIEIEEFLKSLEKRQIYGEEAEKFVLKFEFLRLNGTKEIDWVAEYIVNEGYDIASYDNEYDEYPNRFIEVKSYDGGNPYFYWSRNEFNVAKLKKDEYWLYLINRSEINLEDYKPIMIRNPHETIFINDEIWSKQIENYRIELRQF